MFPSFQTWEDVHHFEHYAVIHVYEGDKQHTFRDDGKCWCRPVKDFDWSVVGGSTRFLHSPDPKTRRKPCNIPHSRTIRAWKALQNSLK